MKLKIKEKKRKTKMSNLCQEL